MKNFKLLSALVFSSFITACGGGGGGDGQSGTNVASVNLGADQSVLEGQTFTLTATVYPEGGNVTLTQVSGPFIEGFPKQDTTTTEVVAPAISADAELVFLAEYDTGAGQRVSDQLTVFVENVNAAPVAVITEAEGAIQPYPTYQTVTLSGANSYDSDGEIREYKWSQADSNSAIEFVGTTDKNQVQFIAPFVSAITSYKIKLEVTDNFGLTGSNEINIQIDSSDTSIAANAGLDQEVDEFSVVTIDGSQSVSTASNVSCAWSVTTSTQINFADASQCRTTFIAPDVDTVTPVGIRLTVTDNANNTATDDLIVTINPKDLGFLHDTGVTECYNNSAVIPCGNTDFPEQDGDSGRDTVAIDKSGSGQRGFDFTKFDIFGDELPNDALVFNCVRDNFTGLVWEVKQPSANPRFSTLRSVDNYYSLDNSLAPVKSCPDTDNCGVENFIDTVNESGFCGGANWRLPTFMELMNIVDYFDVDEDSLLDNEFFPFTPDVAELGHKFYWVSEDNAEGGGGVFNWVINLQTGDDSAIPRTNPAYVILVREP